MDSPALKLIKSGFDFLFLSGIFAANTKMHLTLVVTLAINISSFIMEHVPVRLDWYDNAWFSTGAGRFKRFLWYVINVLFFINPLNPISSLKIHLLRLFGASIGRGVVIKPGVNIKYPWRLKLGNWVWIGEGVWIDNLAQVEIGNHVSVSQGAMLLTGNHNYKSQKFDLIVQPITLEEGCWIGAKSIVCPGVSCGRLSVLAVGSVATADLMPAMIYQGNPASPIRERKLILQ